MGIDLDMGADHPAGHLPPQNLEAEEAVLGAMIVSERVLLTASEILTGDEFYRPSHRIVFSTLLELHADGGMVDELTLRDRLKRNGKLEDCGGTVAILTLCERVPAIANARAYCEEVHERYLLRSVVDGSHKAAQLAYEEKLEDALLMAERTIFGVRDTLSGASGQGRVSMDAAAADWWKSQWENRSNVDMLPFPWTGITDIDGGAARGDVIVISGPTKDGKTWSALDLIETWQPYGAVAMWSLEMTRRELISRLVAMGGFDLKLIRQRKMNANAYKDRLEAIGKWPVDIFDDPFVRIEQIQAQVARAKAMGRPYRVVVLDNMNLVDLPGRDFRVEWNMALRKLKALAMSYGFTLVLLCQLKQSETQYTTPPKWGDIREGGGIAQIASLVLMVWRVREANTGKLTDEAKLLVPLTRNGDGANPVSVQWNPHNTLRFREYGWKPETQPQPVQEALAAIPPSAPPEIIL